MGRGLYREQVFQQALGLEPKDIDVLEKTIVDARLSKAPDSEQKADAAQAEIKAYREGAVKQWKALNEDEQERLAKDEDLKLVSLAKKYVPLWRWDMRPAFTCLVGILLAIALNFCTEDFGPLEVTYDYDLVARTMSRAV